MPKKMEAALRREAKKKGFGKERTEKFVFGSMRRAGWRPSGEKGTRRKR